MTVAKKHKKKSPTQAELYLLMLLYTEGKDIRDYSRKIGIPLDGVKA